MMLAHRFSLPVPAAQAWGVLRDVQRIAPCMPGVTLTSREGDECHGTVEVKVGPVTRTYGGKARFVSLDEPAGVAVIEGSGKETRGTGTAKATITCRLVDRGDSTDVEVDTDLAVTGKPAQFGRGVLADVSAKLVDQFAACLSEEILSGTPESGPEPLFAATAAHLGTPETVAEAAPAPRPAAPRPPAEAIDLLGTAGAPVLKRVAPLLAGLLLLLAVVRRLRR